MTEKNLGGRPPRFNTPEELENAINAYFSECEVKEKPKTMIDRSKDAQTMTSKTPLVVKTLAPTR